MSNKSKFHSLKKSIFISRWLTLLFLQIYRFLFGGDLSSFAEEEYYFMMTDTLLFLQIYGFLFSGDLSSFTEEEYSYFTMTDTLLS